MKYQYCGRKYLNFFKYISSSKWQMKSSYITLTRFTMFSTNRAKEKLRITLNNFRIYLENVIFLTVFVKKLSPQLILTIHPRLKKNLIWNQENTDLVWDVSWMTDAGTYDLESSPVTRFSFSFLQRMRTVLMNLTKSVSKNFLLLLSVPLRVSVAIASRPFG